MGARDVARAIDALRRGWPVALGDIAFLAIETADEAGLAAFDGTEAPAALLISGNRAATSLLAHIWSRRRPRSFFVQSGER